MINFPLVGMILHVRMNMQFYPSADGCLQLQFAATFVMQLALVTLGIQGAAFSSGSMSTTPCPPCRCWRTPGSLTARAEAGVRARSTAGSECRSMAGPSGELGEVEGGSP